MRRQIDPCFLGQKYDTPHIESCASEFTKTKCIFNEKHPRSFLLIATNFYSFFPFVLTDHFLLRLNNQNVALCKALSKSVYREIRSNFECAPTARAKFEEKFGREWKNGNVNGMWNGM